MIKKVLLRLRSVSRTEFVKVSTWSAFSTIVRMASGLVSTKLIAYTIGTIGMGLVGNLMNAVNILSMLGTAGIGQGVTKYVAENFDKPQRQQAFISHAIRVTFVSSLIVSLAIVLFNEQISQFVFNSTEYHSIIILLGVSISLYAFNMLFVYIINGFKQYKRFVQINVISSLFSLVSTIFLVLFFKLYGALAATVAAQSIIIVVTLCYIRKEQWLRDIFKKADIDWNTLKLLGRFSLMTIVSTIVVQLAQLNVRTYIGSSVSPEAAGLWESVNRISAMYLMVITTSISTYYLPRLAELKDNYLLRQEILKTMKLVLPVLAIGCLSIFLLRDIIILILFTKEFAAARDLFAMQMVGDFFKMASWLIAFLFWAKGMTRAFLITEVLFSLGFVLLTRVYMKSLGIEGVVSAYATSYFLYFLMVLFVFRKLLLTKRPSL